MRATIVIRRIVDNQEVKQVYLSRLDERFVRETLADLKRTWPAETYRIDLSQVYWARRAELEQAAA